MTLVDTHTHLYLPEFKNDVEQPATVVRRASEAGVGHMVFPAIDLDTLPSMLELHRELPHLTSVALGLHPTEAGEDWRQEIDSILNSALSTDRIVAIGEIGIDLYWDATYRERQMESFEYQCRLAIERDLPIIVHCRSALDEVLEVLQGVRGVRGVMHSFGGTAEDVERILTVADMHFGINGIVTFKKSTLPLALPAIPADQLLLETDSPYLAPVPYRGRRNESAYIVNTAQAVAQALGLTLDEVATMTTANATSLFNLPSL